MATVTPNFNWPVPTSTDLVKDGATAIEALGDSIDASLVDLKGGTTGQVLSKTSNTDMDFVWVAADDTNAIQNTIVDAKGDLIAASAADTPARLAVGNNGETLVADSSTSTGLRYNPQNALVNPVINGGMDIWQRGTTGFNPNGLVYTADRWQSYSPAIPRTISRQTVSDSTNLPNIQYAIRLQRTAGNTATDYIAIANSFESVNSIPFAGKTVTLSFYARAGANYSAASSAMKAEVYIGTGTDQSVIATGYTGQSTPISQASIPLTTTWQRFAYSGTIASTTTEMAVRFDTNAFVGTAGANDWIEVTGVQIDLGTYTASTAPSFRRSQGTIQGELDACMRYAINFNYNPAGKASYNTIANGYAASTTSARVAVNLPVAMRTQPSSVTTSGNFVLDNTASFPAVTSITINQGGTTTVLLTVNVASGLTSGQNLTLYANNDATASVILSAEL